MKHLLAIILIGFAQISFATNQHPDKLEYQNLKFEVGAGWGHPSPLQTYFYQNHIKYPFKKLSTANYRGHIASWKIKDGKFYLKQIEIKTKSYVPKKFGVKSVNGKASRDNGVFADWFSGTLTCVQVYEEYPDSCGSTHFFQIRHGNVIAHEELKDRSEAKNSDLVDMNTNYVTFYYRLDNDKIVLNGKEGLLNTSAVRLSPIFDYYGKDVLDWPYNWENKEKSGAPLCHWLIEEKSLYLVELTLQYGLRFDTIYTDKLPLEKEFKTEKPTEKVFAVWVNGVYLIFHGAMTKEKTGYEHFKTEEYTFIRIANGRVEESVTVSKEFDFNNPPANTDETLKRLIKDYKIR